MEKVAFQALFVLTNLIILINPLSAQQTDITTFNVLAEVIKACNVSAADMNFGQYSPLTDSTSSSTITVTCTSGTNYTITLNEGLGSGADYTWRKMTSGATDTLNYNLYRDVARTQVWGDGTGGSQTVQDTGSGNSIQTNVYGKIPAGQAAPVGNYQDTIQVTVVF